MTVSTDYAHLNNALTSEFHSQSKQSSQNGQSQKLYAEFSAVLDKIAFHLNSQAEFSESMQIAQQVEVKPKEIQEVKKSAEPKQTEKSAPEEVAEVKPKPKAKEERQDSEELESAPKEVKKEEVEKEPTELEQVASEVEELKQEESEQLEENAEGELAEELVAQSTEATEQGSKQSEQVIQATQLTTDPSKEASKEAKPEAETEFLVEAQSHSQQKFDEAARGASKLVAEVAPEETKLVKEQPLKEQIEILKDAQGQVAQQVSAETATKDQKPFGDLVEQMARALLGKMQSKEGDNLTELATEKIMIDVNANLRPQVEAPRSDIRSSVLSATMLRQLIDGNSSAFDGAAGKSAQVAAPQQAIQAPVAMQQRDQSSGQQEGAQASKARQLPKSLENRTLKRVEEALKEVAKSRDGKTISVRLDPPHLGSVKVDVSMRDGALHARLVAESPAVSQLLRDKGAELQGILRRLGFDVSDVNVSVGYEGGENSSGDTRDLNDEQYQGQQLHNGLGDGLGNATQDANGLENGTSAPADHWIA